MKFERIEQSISVLSGSSGSSRTYKLGNDGLVLSYFFRCSESDINVYLVKNRRREKEFLIEGEKLDLMIEAFRGDSFSVEVVNNSASTVDIVVYLIIQEF